MKILIIGGTGTIGNKVSNYLAKKYQVIRAGRSSGEVTVDIADSRSIKNMFDAIGKVDAIVSIAGEAKWAEFDSLTEEDFYIGLKSKLMGQVNVVRIGQHHLNAGGSITLTTGILADYPVVMTTSAAMVNGGIHSFVKAVSLELKEGKRINVVSPGLVEDSAENYGEYFPGQVPVSMDNVVDAYVKCIEGQSSGEIIRIYGNS